MILLGALFPFLKQLILLYMQTGTAKNKCTNTTITGT